MEEVHKIVQEFQESPQWPLKCYQPEVYFASEIEDRNIEEFVEVITLSLTSSATFPVTIASVTCNAFIDMGATRSCRSETFYNQFMLPWLRKAFYLLVTSASGNTHHPLGIVQCLFKLGGHSFEFNFIVCRNITRPIILGQDFMQKHQAWLGWSDTGKGLLTVEDKVFVETIHFCEIGPQLVTDSSQTFPPRTLEVINVHVDLKGNSTEPTYEVKPSSLLMDQYPNMVVIHVIHTNPKQTDTIVPFVIITCPPNLSFFLNMKF